MSVLTVFIYKLQQNNLNRPQHLSGDRHLLHKQAQLCEVSNSGKEKKHTHTHTSSVSFQEFISLTRSDKKTHKKISFRQRERKKKERERVRKPENPLKSLDFQYLLLRERLMREELEDEEGL